MTLEETLTKALKRHEGFSPTLYKDSVGKWTIGWGHNIEDNGLPLSVCELLLEIDTQRAILNTKHLFPNFDDLSVNRQAALVNMCFNLGMNRLHGFVKMRAAIKAGDFQEAAAQMLDSKWARQVGNRAIDLARSMRDG